MALSERIEKAESAIGVSLPASAPVDGLELIVESYSRGRRADLADLVFDAAVERALKNLITTEHLASERDDLALNREVIAIVGLPRTGSTLLHNVLTLANDVTAITHLDAINATWRSGAISRDAALTDVNARLELMDIMSPGIRDRHPVQADWPDECTLLLANSGASHQWPIMCELPDHLAWLAEADLSAHYDAYRRALAVLADPTPATLVLKSPFHVLQLDHLRRVIPGIKLVATVRASTEVVPSWFGLVEMTQAPLYGAGLAAAYIEQWTTVLGQMASALVDAHEAGLIDEVIRYEDLVADPSRTALRLLGREEVDRRSPYHVRVSSWLGQPEAQRSGKAADVTWVAGSSALEQYDLYFSLDEATTP